MELEPVYNDDYGKEDAANLNFAAGATPATEGTDPSDKPDKPASTEASSRNLTPQAAGDLKPPTPTNTRTLTNQQKMRERINKQ